jgi:putative flippase GtrA
VKAGREPNGSYNCVVEQPATGLRRFSRFIAVGILNTAFGYAVFALLVVLGMNASVALFCAMTLGVLFNFLTTGRLVFNNRDALLLGRFVLSYGVCYLVNISLLQIARGIGVGPIPAQGLCLILIVPLSFVLQSMFVFKRA